jgi:hypothetical protein
MRALDPVSTYIVLLCAGLAAACGGRGDDVILDRDTFIATYVDLRKTALTTQTGELDDPLRAEVLARHGVSEEDMTRFVEVHGEDVAFMQGVWDDIEILLDADRPEADSVPGG